MKRKFSTFCFAILSFSAMSQNVYQEWKKTTNDYKGVDISKYITPDIVRNSLSVNLDLNNESSNIEHESESYSNSTSNNNEFVGNFSSNFSHYINTRKRISYFSLSLNEHFKSSYTDIYSIYNNTENSDTKSTINSQHGLWFGSSNTKYFSKPFFLVYDINASMLYNFSQDKTTDESWGSNKEAKAAAFNFMPRLGFGYGRVENTEDARQAVYMANALSKNGVLTRKLSDEEIFDLAGRMSTVKNKRFLDSRLRLIDEISTVDSFFVNKGLLQDNGAAYFTTLYDMWQYGALYPRGSGWKISFTVRPEYAYQYVKNEPEVPNVIHYPHTAALNSLLIFNYEKPVKLNWQHSIDIGTEAMFRQGKIGQTDFNSIFSNQGKMLWTWAGYSLGYYPNTRTRIKTSIGHRLLNQFTRGIDSDQLYQTYTAGMYTEASYYFSPHVRFAGSFELNYEHLLSGDIIRYNSNSDRFSTLLNVRFFYEIF